MNDRYIFRGKRKDNGEWIYDGIYYQKADEVKEEAVYIIGGSLNYVGAAYEVISETVGQCTGLKDKNGKLIFEGDTLESRASENKEDWERWIVAFFDGSFCFERDISKKRKHKHEQNLLCVDEIELYGLTVIGNIHDNPELLEVTE